MKIKEILFPDMNAKNDENLEKLREQLNSDDWILCLGAGVSISVGLPNWYGLIGKISAEMIPVPDKCQDFSRNQAFVQDVTRFYKDNQNNDNFYRQLQSALNGEYNNVFTSINVLEAAEYILNYLKEDLRRTEKDGEEEGGVFQEKVDFYLNHLIQKACRFPVNPDSDREEFEKKLKDTTLLAVARLMKTDRDSLIHNAVTFNYDDLLETTLEKICGCDPDKIHSIVKADKLSGLTGNEWNIYHVHGRIPVVPGGKLEMSPGVILTESDYYREEQINYSWNNIVQSYMMLRANMIFIGFSGTDYNFRRLVKYVKNEEAVKSERVIFFSVDDIVKSVFFGIADKEMVLDSYIKEMNKEDSKYSFQKLFINYLINAQTIYWEAYGMTVIWTSHEQLFHDLESLHGFT